MNPNDLLRSASPCAPLEYRPDTSNIGPRATGQLVPAGGSYYNVNINVNIEIPINTFVKPSNYIYLYRVNFKNNYL